MLKWERVNRQHHRTRAEARADIFDYIKRCHNPPSDGGWISSRRNNA
jgi:hypothetical protein